jgi:phosphatidylinositol-3-phosphatase
MHAHSCEMRRRSAILTALAGAALAALAMLAIGPQSGDAADPPAAALCGARAASAPPARFQHVIVIFEENHSYDQVIGPPGSTAAARAPYLNSLAERCGIATEARAATHPSNPNYMAATGGRATRMNTVQDAPSIFDQVSAAGGEWRVYQESMPSNCARADSGFYKTGHNPAIWYSPLAADCARWDVPISELSSDLAADTLPDYAFISPNTCNDMHACRAGESDALAVERGDDWLATWIPRITASPSYQNGSTVVFIAWDEGAGGFDGEDCLAALQDESCHIPLVVLSPYIAPGTRAGGMLTLYSVLRASEDMLGINTHLGLAGQAADLRPAFHLAGAPAPPTPTGLTAALAGAARVALNWSATGTPAGFHVFRNGGRLATVPAGQTSYVDGPIAPGVRVTYRVSAFDGAGNESGRSGRASVTMPGGGERPRVTRPPRVQLAGRTLGRRVPVVVSFAADSPNRLCRYRIDAAAGRTAWRVVARRRRAAVGLAPGQTYRFRARAIDCARRPSPWRTSARQRAVVLQNGSTRIAYTGRWHRLGVAQASHRSQHVACVSGASASIRFRGRAVEWVTTRGPSQGAAAITLDGRAAGEVVTFAAAPRWRRIVSRRAWRRIGVHTLRITNARTGSCIALDAIVVLR